MSKKYYLLFLLGIFVCNVATGNETIVAKEVEGYMIDNGKVKNSTPQFEITYVIDGDIITRTKVYDFKNKKNINDNTVYKIQRQLLSDPTKGMSISGKIVIRAIGQPGSNAIEILTISSKFIDSLKSTADYFIFSRQQRLN